MSSSSRTMIATLFACSVLSGCSGDLLAPGSAEGVSASISTASLSPVRIAVRDSVIDVGDTVRILATATNARTARNVSREVKFAYSSSDTAVASVDRKGLVTARANGVTTLTARSEIGRSSVRISVGIGAVKIDSSLVRSLPAAPRVDTLPTPVPPPNAPDLGAPPPMNAPMLPAATVNVAMPSVTGRTVRVRASDGAALQAALNAANGGDEIVLPNGSVFVGNFTLPKHSGTSAVIVRSENVGVAVGSRMTPTAATSLAQIVTTNVAAAITTEIGASNWRLIGLHVNMRAGTVDNYGIITLGNGGETALSQLVSDIVLDRMFITAGVSGNTSRCVAFNGNSLAVIDSWLAECHAKGRDAQAIGGWTGMGPFLIENNHLEGSGQNIMFGGADPKIANVTPSDITIRGNHLFKPMSWANGKWTVKAAFELKHSRRVLFEGNVIENHWADAQVGFAILFQAVNQDGGAPWSKIFDVTVRNNMIKNSTGGFNILSRYTAGGNTPMDPTKRVLLKNNLFLNVGRDPITGQGGRLLQFLSDHEDVSIVQNTFFGATANNAVMFDGAPSKRLLLFNNVFGSTEYGVSGSGYGEGSAAIAAFAPSARFEGNTFTGRIERMYPSQNAFPATLSATDFANSTVGDYTLRASLPYSSNGGSLVGVSGATLLAAIQNVVSR